MRENLIELLAQVVLAVLYGIGALFAAGVGLFIEYHSYVHFSAGEYQLAAWLAAIGGVALFFSYLLITDKLFGTLLPG